MIKAGKFPAFFIASTLNPCYNRIRGIFMVNIFVTSEKQSLCAKMLDNKRLARMAWETAEILCAARWNAYLGYLEKTNKNLTFKNKPYYSPNLGRRKHPVCLWAGENKSHFIWLRELLFQLNEEYKRRYNKDDLKVFKVVYAESAKWIKYFPDGDINFICCMPQEIKELPYSVFIRYKITMVHKYLYLDERDTKWNTPHYDRNPPKWVFNKSIRLILRRLYGKPVNKPYALSLRYFNEIKENRQRSKSRIK